MSRDCNGIKGRPNTFNGDPGHLWVFDHVQVRYVIIDGYILHRWKGILLRGTRLGTTPITHHKKFCLLILKVGQKFSANLSSD